MRKSFGFKLVALFILMLFCVSTGIGLYALKTMQVFGNSISKDDIKKDIDLINQFLDRDYPGSWREEGDVLFKGSVPVDGTFTFLNKIQNLTDSDIILFKGSEPLIKTEGDELDAEILKNILDENETRILSLSNSSDLLFFRISENIGIIPIHDDAGKKLGLIIIRPSVQEINELSQSMQIRMLIGAYSAMLVTALIFLFITKRISRPIPLILNGMRKAEQGELITRVHIKTNDEFEELGEKFNNMVEHLAELIKRVINVSQQVATSAEHLDMVSGESSRATTQIASTVHMVAAGTEDQARSVEQITDTIGDMSRGIQEIADHSHSVLDISWGANEMARTGNERVGNAVVQMNNISTKVNATADAIRTLDDKLKRISYIVDVITGIAKQTNLLALNAAIEAARAGEQGRGFAVVAEEVRKLAEQSGEAGRQIADLIKEIQLGTENVVQYMEEGITAVDKGSAVVNEAGAAFNNIVDSINLVTVKIQEVSVATEQMAAAAQHSVDGMHNVASISEETAASAEEVAAAAQEQSASIEEVAASASMLAHLAEELKKLVNRFKVE